MVNPKPQIAVGLEKITPVLEKIEAGVISVGVPVLLPTRRVLALRLGSFTPSADYIRSSLVGITTTDLENFRLQLLGERRASKALEATGFSRLTFAERFGVPVLLATSLLLGIMTISLLGYPTIASLATKLSLPIFAVCIVLISRGRDGFRRYSFIRLLQEEISRRSGRLGDGSFGNSESSIPLTVCRTPN